MSTNNKKTICQFKGCTTRIPTSEQFCVDHNYICDKCHRRGAREHMGYKVYCPTCREEEVEEPTTNTLGQPEGEQGQCSHCHRATLQIFRTDVFPEGRCQSCIDRMQAAEEEVEEEAMEKAEAELEQESKVKSKRKCQVCYAEGAEKVVYSTGTRILCPGCKEEEDEEEQIMKDINKHTPENKEEEQPELTTCTYPRCKKKPELTNFSGRCEDHNNNNRKFNTCLYGGCRTTLVPFSVKIFCKDHDHKCLSCSVEGAEKDSYCLDCAILRDSSSNNQPSKKKSSTESGAGSNGNNRSKKEEEESRTCLYQHCLNKPHPSSLWYFCRIHHHQCEVCKAIGAERIIYSTGGRFLCPDCTKRADERFIKNKEQSNKNNNNKRAAPTEEGGLTASQYKTMKVEEDIIEVEEETREFSSSTHSTPIGLLQALEKAKEQFMKEIMNEPISLVLTKAMATAVNLTYRLSKK